MSQPSDSNGWLFDAQGWPIDTFLPPSIPDELNQHLTNLSYNGMGFQLLETGFLLIASLRFRIPEPTDETGYIRAGHEELELMIRLNQMKIDMALQDIHSFAADILYGEWSLTVHPVLYHRIPLLLNYLLAHGISVFLKTIAGHIYHPPDVFSGADMESRLIGQLRKHETEVTECHCTGVGPQLTLCPRCEHGLPYLFQTIRCSETYCSWNWHTRAGQQYYRHLQRILKASRKFPLCCSPWRDTLDNNPFTRPRADEIARKYRVGVHSGWQFQGDGKEPLPPADEPPDQCVLCMDRPAVVKTQPCRHQIICESCVIALKRMPYAKCPQCTVVIKAFLPPIKLRPIVDRIRVEDSP